MLVFFNKLKEMTQKINLIQVFSDNEHVIVSKSDSLFYYHQSPAPIALYVQKLSVLDQLFSSLDHHFRLKELYFLVLNSSNGNQYHL